MSYNPTTWNTGDIVSAEKLNKMEQGIANAGVLVCNVVEENETTRLDHTWQEIADAGFAVVIQSASTDYGVGSSLLVVTEFGEAEGTKIVSLRALGNSNPPIEFICQNANDYPVLYEENGGGGNSNPAAN